MEHETPQISTQTAPEPNSAPAKPPRLWPAVILVACYWVMFFIVGGLEMPYFFRFLYGMAAPALLALVFFIWWWCSRRIRLSDRLYGFVLIVAGAAAALPLVHTSFGWFGLLMTGLPAVLTVWTLWLLLMKRTSFRGYRLGSLAVVLPIWAFFMLIRMDGLNGELRADMRWRWSPTAEDLFLAEKADQANSAIDSQPTQTAGWAPALGPNDWTGFRGPNRDGVIRGVTINTDWNARPPSLLWRQRVGPAWSSVTVIGDRVFTQEQRGEREAVVCYQADTGKELWVHEDAARFYESVSGAGPRATPTFANGRIYSLGAKGLFNCLDAAAGKRHWSRQVADEAARSPMWGFSSSPLVANGMVVVYGGGTEQKNLQAYRADSGEPLWTAEAGKSTYSSPQLTTIAGTPQILLLSDFGLTAVDPARGAVLWQTGVSLPDAPRPTQPHLLGDSQLLVGSLNGFDIALIDVTREGDAWKVAQRWQSKGMKPEFPDFVVHQGHAYGFDVGIFCCLDLATGKRTWKAGRYGHGVVVLLADQALLLVVSETGEAILLPANPERHQELGRFRLLTGKTWNHPVIAHGRLYARNADEMACYELAGK